MRANQGRKTGSINEATRVARALAARADKLPHELMLQWARTGTMRNAFGRDVQMTAAERVACARGCAAWYAHPKAATQPKDAPPPVVRVELDVRLMAALAKTSPDRLEMFRDVLTAIQAGGAGVTNVVAQAVGELTAGGDASRYAQMMSDEDMAGNA